jgi:hypothetical protein
MADALAHSCDSHSRGVGLNFSESFRGHSIPLVFNLDVDPVPFALKSNQRGFASRVTMNVCQTLLHRSEGDLRMRFGPIMRCPDKRPSRPRCVPHHDQCHHGKAKLTACKPTNHLIWRGGPHTGRGRRITQSLCANGTHRSDLDRWSRPLALRCHSNLLSAGLVF